MQHTGWPARLGWSSVHEQTQAVTPQTRTLQSLDCTHWSSFHKQSCLTSERRLAIPRAWHRWVMVLPVYDETIGLSPKRPMSVSKYTNLQDLTHSRLPCSLHRSRMGPISLTGGSSSQGRSWPPAISSRRINAVNFSQTCARQSTVSTQSPAEPQQAASGSSVLLPAAS